MKFWGVFFLLLDFSWNCFFFFEIFSWNCFPFNFVVEILLGNIGEVGWRIFGTGWVIRYLEKYWYWKLFLAYPLINRQKFNIFSSKFFFYSVNDHPIEKDFELRDRDIYCRSFVNFVFDLFSSFLTSFQIIIQFFVEIFGRRCWFSFCFSATASTSASSCSSTRTTTSRFLYSSTGRSIKEKQIY